jgi:SAM-dependent methyltransferase
MGKRVDGRNRSLDHYLVLSRLVTGEENLHYGIWTGLDVTVSDMKAAMAAYNRLLLERIGSGGPWRVLDVGGGAGVLAGRLGAMGHTVDIVIPSPVLAARCGINAPRARVFQTTFEAFARPSDRTEGFDLVLFAESFQYIPPAMALDRALDLLAPGGRIIISDCHRSEAHYHGGPAGQVGGGHRLSEVETLLAERPLRLLWSDDITEAVAPTVELQQKLMNAIGESVRMVNEDMKATRPILRGLLTGLYRLGVTARRRRRLEERLNGSARNREAFALYNRYLLWVLERAA